MLATKLESRDVAQYILSNYDGVCETVAWGETTFFYNPNHLFARGTYFATIKEKDGANDKASNLNRPEVFRLNIGIPKPLFIQHFGHPPKRPAKGNVIEGTWDFTKVDQIIPHPVYGWMSWVAVLNPSIATFEKCKPLLEESYGKARCSFEKRKKYLSK